LETNDYGFQFYVRLFPAIMQGEQVEQSIISALNQINERIDDFDVVVIIRGGGATADLSGFDTLNLAENVANFPLPIITGIGHERDESVLDMISHTRVKTPTAAASFLIDNLTHVFDRIENSRQAISHYVSRRMEVEKMRLDKLSEKIPMLFSMVKSKQEMILEKCNSKLVFEVRKILAAQTYRLDQLNLSFRSLKHHIYARETYRLDLLSQRVAALDPMLVLKRGYSITLHNGKSVRNPSDLSDGDVIETRLEKGSVKSIVTKK
jgi:exodeoxyribonuclease VII large subunit